MIKYIVEFIGTFLFLSVILRATAPNSSLTPIAPLAIVLGLFASIAFGGAISGGHFNPAVSTMMVLHKSLPVADFVPYVAAQILGGIAAMTFFDMTLTNK
jgi:aquaporin Z